MKCVHPKRISVWWGQEFPGWACNTKGQVVCRSCDRVIGSVDLNGFALETSRTSEGRRYRRGKAAYRVSGRLLG